MFLKQVLIFFYTLNYYWLNIKGCAYQRTNFSMSKLSKSLCNFLASQISHQKQPWSEKILQMSEMFKIWFQNTSSSGWACQVFSYDKGRNTYILSSYLPALYFLSGLNLIFTACVACKIQYLDQKWSSSNLIFQT